MTNSKQENEHYYIWGIVIIILLILVTLVIWWQQYAKKCTFWQDFFKQKINKSEVAEWYGVDKKTFSKWIHFFCKGTPLYISYSYTRKLDWAEILILWEQLGTPFEPSYTKKQIALECESDTNTLYTYLLDTPRLYPLSRHAYRSLNIFPPKIGQKIKCTFDQH